MIPLQIRLKYHSVAALAVTALCTFGAVRAQELGDPAAALPPSLEAAEAEAGLDVLTRGPVHEAFAEIVNYDPKPGEVVSKPPPDPIDELPPETRPEGDDVVWLAGYWAFDDERDDFLWVSGVWRKVPPGSRWVQGYWAKQPAVDGSEAWQWISGFWAPADAGDLEYRDIPPASLERGPSSPAPADDYFWTPGVWEYRSTAYRWRPGYWNAYRPGWVWVPARFVWTPRGCLFLGGYWDYPLAYRGHLYAPVYFPRPIYRQPGYCYAPRVVIGGPSISIHLFFRATHGHMYFGDYYGPHYARRHYAPCFDHHVRHRGYDPVFAYNQVSFRKSGINYEQRVRGWNTYFNDHSDLRPAHTHAAQQQFVARHARNENLQLAVMGTPVKELAARHDPKQPLVHINRAQRDAAVKQAAERTNMVRERREIETKFSGSPRPGQVGAGGKPGGPADKPELGRPELPTARLHLPAEPKVAGSAKPPASLDAPRNPPAGNNAHAPRNGRDRGPAGTGNANLPTARSRGNAPPESKNPIGVPGKVPEKVVEGGKPPIVKPDSRGTGKAVEPPQGSQLPTARDRGDRIGQPRLPEGSTTGKPPVEGRNFAPPGRGNPVEIKRDPPATGSPAVKPRIQVDPPKRDTPPVRDRGSQKPKVDARSSGNDPPPSVRSFNKPGVTASAPPAATRRTERPPAASISRPPAARPPANSAPPAGRSTPGGRGGRASGESKSGKPRGK